MQHPQVNIQGEPTARALNDADLRVLIAQAVTLLERIEREADGDPSAHPGRYAHNQRRKLAVLRVLLSMHEPVIEPKLNHLAPQGHACSWIDESFGLEPGGGMNILEELADLGLLTRELHNVVNLCPKCAWCQVNFRETCRSCGSIDVHVEGLIHHFRCAYIGLEHEFAKDLDLICPKCNRHLHQLGQDFERPHDTYSCGGCHYLFEEPVLEGQCLHCEHAFSAGTTETARIFRYRPTALTVRAIELNRLTGLDVNSVMFDDSVRLASRDYLALQVEREIARIKRYGGEFCCAVFSFRHGRNSFSMFREWPSPVLRRLGRMLGDSLRDLDMVCRLDQERIGVFLAETGLEGAAVARDRLFETLGELALTTRSGNPVTPHWVVRAYGKEATVDEVMAFVDGPG